jgi:excisionase family DNA binding protein
LEKLLATIPEASQAIGHGRSYIYELIGDGKIETVKSGKRRLVVVESLRAYVASLRVAA